MFQMIRNDISQAGIKIRQLRQLFGFGQSEMAEKLSMTQGNYARIENQEIRMTERNLALIAEIFGCTPEAILHFDAEGIEDLYYKAYPEDDAPVTYVVTHELKALYEKLIAQLEDQVNQLQEEAAALKTTLENAKPAA